MYLVVLQYRELPKLSTRAGLLSRPKKRSGTRQISAQKKGGPDFYCAPGAVHMDASQHGQLGGRPTKGKAMRSAIMLAVVAGSQRTLAFGGESLSLSAPPPPPCAPVGAGGGGPGGGAGAGAP